LFDNYKFAPDYPFIRDGKFRSPWYDAECLRCENDPIAIARELDMDEDASRKEYFQVEMLNAHAARWCRPPDYVGTLVFDEHTLAPIRFVEDSRGVVQVWGEMERNEDGNLIPPRHIKFAHFADVSGGSQQSNSVISIGDIDSGKKWVEIVSCGMTPTQFGQIGVATARWFNNAYAGWDAIGPCGQNYGRVFDEAGYRNVHFHVNEDHATPTPGKKPGVYLQPRMRMFVLSLYRDSLGRANRGETPLPGSFINPSSIAIQHPKECLAYEWLPDGTVDHNHVSASRGSTEDPSGARHNHGDRCMADAGLCYLMSKTRVPVEVIQPRKEAPEGSMVAMMEMEDDMEFHYSGDEDYFKDFNSWGSKESKAIVGVGAFDSFNKWGSSSLWNGGQT